LRVAASAARVALAPAAVLAARARPAGVALGLAVPAVRVRLVRVALELAMLVARVRRMRAVAEASAVRVEPALRTGAAVALRTVAAAKGPAVQVAIVYVMDQLRRD
jgi:hypothetical protein